MSLPDRVAVIGAGTMGHGIAQTFAAAGTEAILVDVEDDFVKAGLAAIAKSLDRFVKKEKITTEKRDEILGRITATTAFDAVSGADLVIEAVTENLDVKREVFGRMDATAPDGAILASNTSSISITTLGAAPRVRPGSEPSPTPKAPARFRKCAT